jgi:hypothetical protein
MILYERNECVLRMSRALALLLMVRVRIWKTSKLDRHNV